jgi:hypothetical protein
MPYPNEHSARINSPARYTRFFRKKFGKGISAVMGVLPSGAVEIQALRFSIGQWDAHDARAWLKRKGFGDKHFVAATYANNPLSVDDIYIWLETSIDEEKKGIKDYEKFLKYLPEHESTAQLRVWIEKILHDEKMHVKGLQTFYRS